MKSRIVYFTRPSSCPRRTAFAQELPQRATLPQHGNSSRGLVGLIGVYRQQQDGQSTPAKRLRAISCSVVSSVFLVGGFIFRAMEFGGSQRGFKPLEHLRRFSRRRVFMVLYSTRPGLEPVPRTPDCHKRPRRRTAGTALHSDGRRPLAILATPSRSLVSGFVREFDHQSQFRVVVSTLSGCPHAMLENQPVSIRCMVAASCRSTIRAGRHPRRASVATDACGAIVGQNRVFVRAQPHVAIVVATSAAHDLGNLDAVWTRGLRID